MSNIPLEGKASPHFKYNPEIHLPIFSKIMEMPNLNKRWRHSFTKIAQISPPTFRKWLEDIPEIKKIYSHGDKYPFANKEEEEHFERQVKCLKRGDFEPTYDIKFHYPLIKELVERDGKAINVMKEFCDVSNISESTFRRWRVEIEDFGAVVAKGRYIKLPKFKYDPETHLPLFAKGFRDNKSIVEMCKEVGISTTTFNYWKKLHPEFDEMVSSNRIETRGVKYDPDVHIPMLRDTLKKGESKAYFCAQAVIAKKTFYSWMNKHAEFKETYDIYENHAQSYWEGLGLNPEINNKVWQIQFNGRFRNRWKVMPFHTSWDIMQVVQEGLANIDGEDYAMTLDEADKLVKIAYKRQEMELKQKGIEEQTSEESSMDRAGLLSIMGDIKNLINEEKK